MKTSRMIRGCVFVLFLIGPAFAVSTVKFTPGEIPGDPGFGFDGGGGEMWTHVLTGSLGIYGSGESFATFCVEIEEPINFATVPPYDSPVFDAVVNPLGAVQGGFGGNPDPISDHTAWLYLQFVSGSLAPYEYDGTVNGGLDREESAKAMQYVIWGLEYELDPLNDLGAYFNRGKQGLLVTNPYGALQQEFFNLADVAIEGGWTNDGLVQVVNVYESGTYGTDTPVYKQDILVVVPAPGAIGLVLFGVGVFGYLKRKHTF